MILSRAARVVQQTAVRRRDRAASPSLSTSLCSAVVAARRSAASSATPRRVTAAYVAIGDEILNGKTENTNGTYLARLLFRRGVSLQRMDVIPDDAQMIGDVVKQRYGVREEGDGVEGEHAADDCGAQVEGV